jgi:hypothetical protein
VIGVVGSVRDTALAGSPVRAVYFPETAKGDTLNGQLQRTMAVVARTRADVAATTRAIQSVIRGCDGSDPPTFGVRSMRTVTLDASMALLAVHDGGARRCRRGDARAGDDRLCTA